MAEGARGGLGGGDGDLEGARRELKGFGWFAWVEAEKGFFEIWEEAEKGFAFPIV